MTTVTERADGAQIMREFIPANPFVNHVGIELGDIGDGVATLTMPFRDELVTIGTVVHGGAIATLIDTSVAVAAWAGAEVPDKLRGVTVALSVTYLRPAEAADLVARAGVLHRGRSLTEVEVDVHTTAGAHVATALATYKLG